VVKVALVGVAASAMLLMSLVAVVTLTGGCEERHEALAEGFRAESILHAAPGGSTAMDWSSWCDDDDVSMVAYQVWTSRTPREEVSRFYWQAAARDGWQPASEHDVPGRVDCYSKRIGELDAYLAVQFPPESVPELDYWISVRAYESDDIGCPVGEET
jgi:hypothetical protein